jgi:hypothetical protein
MACTAAKSVTDAPLAMASPPAARISSTTACAGADRAAATIHRAAQVVDQHLGAARPAPAHAGAQTAARAGHDGHAALEINAHEECGVLFSPGADPATAMAWLREGRSFAEVLELLRLRLDTQALVPWSRWITPRVPSVSSKRFDTRFFVATVPPGQAATHDNREATESLWLPPRAALERYWANTLPLAPPQIMSLAHLSHFASAADVLQAARSRRPPVIQPEPYQLDDGRLICYPGDPQHPVAERALPGSKTRNTSLWPPRWASCASASTRSMRRSWRLLAERALCVRDATRFKLDAFQVAAPARQAQVFAKVRALAAGP